MEEDISDNKINKKKIVKFEELKKNYDKRKKRECIKNKKLEKIKRNKELKLEEEVRNYNKIRNMKVSEVIATLCNIEKYMEGNY